MLLPTIRYNTEFFHQFLNQSGFAASAWCSSNERKHFNLKLYVFIITTLNSVYNIKSKVLYYMQFYTGLVVELLLIQQVCICRTSFSRIWSSDLKLNNVLCCRHGVKVVSYKVSRQWFRYFTCKLCCNLVTYQLNRFLHQTVWHMPLYILHSITTFNTISFGSW